MYYTFLKVDLILIQIKKNQLQIYTKQIIFQLHTFYYCIINVAAAKSFLKCNKTYKNVN